MIQNSASVSPTGENEATGLDVYTLMNELALQRTVFHSEADFQHALAWLLHKRSPDSVVRLEYPPFPGEAFRLDILLSRPTARYALELKYPTRHLTTTTGTESFALKNHGAQDVIRYDFIKDIARLERITQSDPRILGLAIMLTNDDLYWRTTERTDTADAAFRIHQGRALSGTLAWGPGTGAGTMKGRELAIPVQGDYQVHWRDYSAIPQQRLGTFRYLAIKVGAWA